MIQQTASIPTVPLWVLCRMLSPSQQRHRALPSALQSNFPTASSNRRLRWWYSFLTQTQIVAQRSSAPSLSLLQLPSPTVL